MNHTPRDLRKRFDASAGTIRPAFKESLRQKLYKENSMAAAKKPSLFKRGALYLRKTPALAVFAALVIVGTSSAMVATNRANTARNAEIAVPSNLSELLSFDDIRSLATADAANNSTISGIELEQEDGRTVYKVKYSDGTVRIYDAKTGDRITKPSTETDESVPAGFSAGISADRARQIALEQRPGKTVTKIELETEEGVVVYSVRFSDDGRVDVNASNGSVVRVRDGKSSSTSSSSSGSAAVTSDNSGSGSSNPGSGSSDDDSRSGSDDSGDDSDDHGGDDDNSGSGRSGRDR